MKWLILNLWIIAIIYNNYRGQVRLKFTHMFVNHSIVLAPINMFMVLMSKVPRTPFISLNEIQELKILQDNWMVFRDEAVNLSKIKKIKAAEKHDDIGFNSFFKYGWKRFYLKWYDASHPSAIQLCPKSIKLLKSIPSVKAAMFAELPPNGKLNPHKDPYAGSIRYHLGLITPNDNKCFINVDGKPYSWRDGEGVLFDETYIHEAYNHTNKNRIILFCDIERPLKFKFATIINNFFSHWVMSATSSPNEIGDQTGFINRLTHFHWKLEQSRKKLKSWNKTVYKITKYSLYLLILIGFYYV
ncbi:MAG: aspartyl/asparaginyl beta-hydroxylase domain-containing protein [Candidatus Methylopumilus sp.]|nr:aspartyl/asparaginyl beta-hydroxylase domain-containing protein [Candidatus Methylopumilus sp.]